MANVNNTLYPPLIPAYQPAFVRTQTCKVYFSLSSFNSYEEISSQAQVTVSSQLTNQSVLKPSLYPNSIKVCAVRVDATRSSDKYYIELSPADLINGFEINQYYKVQIRFTSKDAPMAPVNNALDKWLTDNVGYFSEWSRICLIRGISPLSLNIQGLVENTEVILTKPDFELVGTLVYDEPAEKDTLNSYQIKLYNEVDELISDSGIIFTSPYYGTNEVNYTFNYQFVDGDSYTIVLDIETKNHYVKTYIYKFLLIEVVANQLDAKITATPDVSNGRIKIELLGSDSKFVMENITIRRASSRTNFSVWEDVYTVPYTSYDGLNLTWYDCTIESGIWYLYAAQKRDNRGERGSPIYIDNPVMVMFEDLFLNADNQQLRIKYNPKVTSFKHNIPESKVDTLGSKYPYITRNGYVDYRQMSISGLITLFDDRHNVFTSREELLNGPENIELYDEYNDKNRITKMNDYVWEREFRQKVIDFLYADNVKLFRTLTEGNILVRLMNINFSPEEQLGRYLYSFSADAYEIAESSIKNCDEYGVQTIGEYSSFLSAEKEILSQLSGVFEAGSRNDVINLIKEKYSNQVDENVIMNFQKLKTARLHFVSKPYLIKETAQGQLAPLETSDNSDQAIALGYIVYVNGTPIIVNPEGYYDIVKLDVTSLWFPVESEVEINYVADFIEEENLAKTAIETYDYKAVIGQVWGEFGYKQSVYNEIWNKYHLDYTAYYQDMIALNSIKIEANPNTVIYIKTSEDEQAQRYVINDTCLLNLYDKDLYIKEIYFAGTHLDEAQDENRDLIASNLFLIDSTSAASLEEIEEPKNHHVYTIDNTRYIWYNEQWEVFNELNDVEINVDGMIDYACDVVKGVYAST